MKKAWPHIVFMGIALTITFAVFEFYGTFATAMRSYLDMQPNTGSVTVSIVPMSPSVAGQQCPKGQAPMREKGQLRCP